jgi:hypothetical protein
MLFRAFSDELGGFVFPSYSLAVKPTYLDMNHRRFSVMVSANKFCRTVSGLRLWKPRRFYSWIRGKLNVERCRFLRSVQKDALYEKRLEILNTFETNHDLDLFGSGWDNLGNLPLRWRRLLDPKLQNRGRCENKISTISNYRFCFAIENYSFPSYITEKIIEAIYSGCVPVYIGAPDISQTIPKDHFLHIKDYVSLSDLRKKMHTMSIAECEDIVYRAQQWLIHEPAGRAFSYEAFADRFIQGCIKPLALPKD